MAVRQTHNLGFFFGKRAQVKAIHLQTGEGEVEYGGSKPFSEPETRIVRLVAENTQPQAYVNLHSGEWAHVRPVGQQKGNCTRSSSESSS